jgi:TatA/E family protein of Tat protein translocase
MFNIGPAEVIVILLIALLVVGPKRLPEMGRTIAKGVREFRRATEEARYAFKADLDEKPSPDGKGEAPQEKRTERSEEDRP